MQPLGFSKALLDVKYESENFGLLSVFLPMI